MKQASKDKANEYLLGQFQMAQKLIMDEVEHASKQVFEMRSDLADADRKIEAAHKQMMR